MTDYRWDMLQINTIRLWTNSKKTKNEEKRGEKNQRLMRKSMQVKSTRSKEIPENIDYSTSVDFNNTDVEAIHNISWKNRRQHKFALMQNLLWAQILKISIWKLPDLVKQYINSFYFIKTIQTVSGFFAINYSSINLYIIYQPLFNINSYLVCFSWYDVDIV